MEKKDKNKIKKTAKLKPKTSLLAKMEKLIDRIREHKKLKATKNPAQAKKEVKKIREIAAEIKKQTIVTDFDRVMFHVNNNKRTTVNKTAQDLSIDKKRVEECAKILEEAEILEIEYPIMGGIVLQVKGYKQKTKKEKK